MKEKEKQAAILVQGGTLVSPGGKNNGTMDVLVKEEKIVKIAKHIAEENCETIDAAGCLVCPGFLDMHVHLREPGFEHKEDIVSGTLAAARGGFTAVACMANTQPCVDNRSVVEFIRKKAGAEGRVTVYPVGAVTRGLEGSELSDIGEMKEAGIAAISDDGKGVQNAGILRHAMEYAAMFSLPVISHAEDHHLSACGVMHEGFAATRLGLRGIPAEAETVMIARDVLLAELTGCAVHIAHVSSKGALKLIRDAKKQGIRITCEVTPHHLSLVDRMLESYDTSLKVNPPLREPEDILELRRALKDGTIDCIATDHAPHAVQEKEVEFDKAPFGLIGLETAVGVVIQILTSPSWTDYFEPFVQKSEWKFKNDDEEKNLCLTAEEIVQKLSVNPRRILNVSGGALEEGAVADISVIEPHREWLVDANAFASKSRNCPYHNHILKGKARATIVSGRMAWQETQIKVKA